MSVRAQGRTWPAGAGAGGGPGFPSGSPRAAGPGLGCGASRGPSSPGARTPGPGQGATTAGAGGPGPASDPGLMTVPSGSPPPGPLERACRSDSPAQQGAGHRGLRVQLLLAQTGTWGGGVGVGGDQGTSFPRGSSAPAPSRARSSPGASVGSRDLLSAEQPLWEDPGILDAAWLWGR